MNNALRTTDVTTSAALTSVGGSISLGRVLEMLRATLASVRDGLASSGAARKTGFVHFD